MVLPREVKFTRRPPGWSSQRLRMAIDLTQYSRKHEKDLRHASELAKHYIESYDEKKCCAECSITMSGGFFKVEDDGHKSQMLRLLDIVESVLWSSGYYVEIRRRSRQDKLHLTIRMVKMSAEEKKENLGDDETVPADDMD